MTDIEERANVTVRRLRPGDEAVLAQLAADAPDFDIAGRTSRQAALSSTDANAYLTDPSVLHWVAEDASGTVLGDLVCYVERRPSSPPRQLLLYEIGVRSRYRRQGVGRKLLEAMREWLRAEGVNDVWVLADNPDAEEFYSALGFERDEEQAVQMSLSLES